MSQNTLFPQLAAKQDLHDTFSFKLSTKPTTSSQKSKLVSMSHHRFHSLGSTVPFSWENSPGVSKIAPRADDSSSTDDSPDSVHAAPRLPPPPCPDDSPRRLSGGRRHSIHVPLPPCPFQAPPTCRYSRDEDPFLAAYMECTKSTRVKKNKEGKRGSWAWLGLGLGRLSCKQGSGVREDGLARLQAQVDQHHKFNGRDRDRETGLLERSQSQGSGRATKGTHQRRRVITGANVRV